MEGSSELHDAINNCSGSGDYIVASAINAASAFGSLLICLFVMATILLYKKYIIPTQQLILFLCIAAILASLAMLIDAIADFINPGSHSFSTFCLLSGFIFQQTHASFYISIMAIVVDMYMRIVKQKDTTRFTKLYFFTIFIFPFLFNWIPFIELSYGGTGPWCWIRTVNNNENCTTHKLGVVLKFTNGYIPILAGCIVCIVLYILIVRHLHRLKYTGKYDPQKEKLRKQLIKEAMPFLIYPWVFFAINFISLLTGLVAISLGRSQANITFLWSINGAVGSAQGGIAAVIFGLQLETLQRLFRMKSYLGCCQHKVKEYPAILPDRSDSFVDTEKVTAYTEAMHVCTLNKTEH